MSRITVSFHTQNPARCPWCQADLSPQGATILDGVLLCVDCSQLRTLLDAGTLHADASKDPNGRCWSIRKGVLIYTPPSWYPRTHSAVVADLIAQDPDQSGISPGNSR